MSSIHPDPASYRDPSGFIFTHKGVIYRQVNKRYQEDFDACVSSGLFKDLMSKKMLISHKEIELSKFTTDEKAYKVLQPERIPFISYPYEWSFGQLKAAALLTLRIAQASLSRDMTLKDASAYNIQFLGTAPIHIDSLSFEKYVPGEPWIAYKQFCEHFLAPLAVAAYRDPSLLKSLRVYMDGLPLQTAADLLPLKARLNVGLLTHLYIHGSSQKRHESTSEVSTKPATAPRMNLTSLQALLDNLVSTVSSLRLPASKTQWSHYYEDTNYTDAAMGNKEVLVSEYLKKIKPKRVYDLGANTGRFSELAAKSGASVVAMDFDVGAVEAMYTHLDSTDMEGDILPLVMDLSNPSPSLGFAQAERMGLQERGGADCVLALALIHHLCIGHNIPLGSLSRFFASLGEHLIVEFVPKNDSQVTRLLRSREDIFNEYTIEGLEKAFSHDFTLVEKRDIKGTVRTLYLFKRRS